MKTGKIGKAIIKVSEGLILHAYLCPAGVPTIGYGHTKGVKMGDVITQEEANRLLDEDLIDCEEVFRKHVTTELNQSQYDAVISFIFNIGEGDPEDVPIGRIGFCQSTLKKKINANPSDPTIADEFKRWIYGDGKILQGLVTRRRAEAELYFSNSYE